MPEALERELVARARKKGMTGKRKDAYVYGSLRKTGWVPSHQSHQSHQKESKMSFGKRNH